MLIFQGVREGNFSHNWGLYFFLTKRCVLQLGGGLNESQHQHGAIDMTGGFKHFLFSPLFGEMIQFDEYFSDGLKPPTSQDFWALKTMSFEHTSEASWVGMTCCFRNCSVDSTRQHMSKESLRTQDNTPSACDGS